MGRWGTGGAALRSGFARFGLHLRSAAPAYGVLLIALLLTVFAWHYVRQNVEAQNRVRFDETVRATQVAIERRTKAYLDAMFGARGLFYASTSVHREEWGDYVEGLEPNKRFEGLQALSYAERVTPEEREAFARRVRKEGLPGLRPDLDPGGERPAYFPITYTGPLDGANESRLNYDLHADPAHRVAMDRARDAGAPRATKMVYVLTEAPPDSSADLALRTGFVVYLPVYREGKPLETVAERRRALEGFVVGFFVIDELLDGIFKGSFVPAIDFEVYDGANTASSPLLYDHDGIKRAGDAEKDELFTSTRRVEVAGRMWSLYFATLPEFEAAAQSELPLFVLASGIAVSALLFGVTWMLIRSRLLALHTTTELEEANRSLEAANQELEAFSYSVSHDLRAPLRSIEGFSQILLEDYANTLDETGKNYLNRVRAASLRMALLIDDLLTLSRVARSSLKREVVNLSALAKEVAKELEEKMSSSSKLQRREVRFIIEEGLVANADASLMRVVLENLLANALKFTSKEERALIEFGSLSHDDDDGVASYYYYVKDNGVGFDERYSEKLFGAFQRLHTEEEFEGTGIGLATVARIVHRHGGKVWAKGEVGKGATFCFTLGGRRQGSSLPSKKAGIS